MNKKKTEFNLKFAINQSLPVFIIAIVLIKYFTQKSNNKMLKNIRKSKGSKFQRKNKTRIINKDYIIHDGIKYPINQFMQEQKMIEQLIKIQKTQYPMGAYEVYDEIQQNQMSQQRINIVTELNYMNKNNIGDNGMNMIITSKLTQLRSLYVGWNNITSLGLSAMPETLLNRLENLNLHFNSIGKQGILLLIKAKLPQLKFLSLSICDIGDEGAKYLTKAQWTNLQKLAINDNNINIGGYEAIAAKNWKKFKLFQTIKYGCSCCGIIMTSAGVGLPIFDISYLTFICWEKSITKIFNTQSAEIRYQRQFVQIFNRRNQNDI